MPGCFILRARVFYYTNENFYSASHIKVSNGTCPSSLFELRRDFSEALAKENFAGIFSLRIIPPFSFAQMLLRLSYGGTVLRSPNVKTLGRRRPKPNLCSFSKAKENNRTKIKPFLTLDGSMIRELCAHRNSPLKNCSLAETVVIPGKQTRIHHHRKAQELYYILRDTGKMRVGKKSAIVKKDDTILIMPGEKHTIKNRGKGNLVFLQCRKAKDTFLTALISLYGNIVDISAAPRKHFKKRYR